LLISEFALRQEIDWKRIAWQRRLDNSF